MNSKGFFSFYPYCIFRPPKKNEKVDKDNKEFEDAPSMSMSNYSSTKSGSPSLSVSRSPSSSPSGSPLKTKSYSTGTSPASSPSKPSSESKSKWKEALFTVRKKKETKKKAKANVRTALCILFHLSFPLIRWIFSNTNINIFY